MTAGRVACRAPLQARLDPVKPAPSRAEPEPAAARAGLPRRAVRPLAAPARLAAQEGVPRAHLAQAAVPRVPSAAARSPAASRGADAVQARGVPAARAPRAVSADWAGAAQQELAAVPAVWSAAVVQPALWERAVVPIAAGEVRRAAAGEAGRPAVAAAVVEVPRALPAAVRVWPARVLRAECLAARRQARVQARRAAPE
jgi:hypothetical protein